MAAIMMTIIMVMIVNIISFF